MIKIPPKPNLFWTNSVNSELWFFWALLKPAKIWNLSKNVHAWAAWKTSSSELKKCFDPSLGRSWYDFFRTIRAHGPKHQPPVQPRGVIGAPYYVFSKDAILGSVPSISSVVLGLPFERSFYVHTRPSFTPAKHQYLSTRCCNHRVGISEA